MTRTEYDQYLNLGEQLKDSAQELLEKYIKCFNEWKFVDKLKYHPEPDKLRYDRIEDDHVIYEKIDYYFQFTHNPEIDSLWLPLDYLFRSDVEDMIGYSFLGDERKRMIEALEEKRKIEKSEREWYEKLKLKYEKT